MAGESRAEETLAAERRVLQAMCTGTPQGPVWEEGMRALARYRFCSFIHQVVFDTLRELSRPVPEVIREQLAPRLTRKGFPDVEVEELFAPHHLSRAEALDCISRLRAGPQAPRRS